MKWKWTRAALLAAAGLVAGSTLGCAEERAPINRVQADALAKSFFVGEDLADDADNPSFYTNGTLMDVGYGAAQSALFSAWYANALSIIRWEVTEDLLIGRLAYERINGSDGKGASNEVNDGQVLYIFRINSHFDIKRAYNPTTGEEMNVIEENSSDRPWYQREYFRVDWSQNLNQDAYDYDQMALLGVLDGVKYEPIAYYINDPSHPHAPHFDPQDGYFDITTKSFAAPQMVDISHLGWGIDSIPACFMDGDAFGGSAPAGNCNPVELTIRSSFWKVQDKDYQPADWDGFMFQSYGAFTVERYGFARNYGMSDTEWRRFISRYNIWERSHAYSDPENMTGATECYTPATTPIGMDANRDNDFNGTADECEAVGGGSQCDTFKQKCTLPYAQREVAPILWYYTTDSDNRYFEGTSWATQEWDAAMRIAIQTAKYSECKRIGGAESCDSTFPVPHGQMTEMRDIVEIMAEVDAARDRGEDGGAVASQKLQARGYDPSSYDFTALKTILDMDDAVILCHSPIQADDHPLCAEGRPRLPEGITAMDCQQAKADGGDESVRAECKRAYNVRIGDVRYHLINVIEDPESPSPWGFGPTFADPLTGEAISASINVWTWPTDFISQSTIDTSRYIAGELSTSDVTDGEFVKDWAQAANLAGGGGAMPPMKASELHDRISQGVRAVGRNLETGEAQGSGQAINPEDIGQFADQLKKARELQQVRADAYAPTTMGPTYRVRRDRARGTETEAALTTPAMMELAGVGQGGIPADAALEMASPLRGPTGTQQQSFRQLSELKLAERGACMLHPEEAPSPTAMVGLGNMLQEKFGSFSPNDEISVQLERADRMKKYLAQRLHFAVIVHEMGHTFGYRHNFVSSSSAFNYRPQYWQLRTKNGAVTEECVDLTESEAEAAGCIGPRYFDQVTNEERDNLIPMWMHSSVMDYAGDITQDLLGLGAYDFAAAKMFYGETATVFMDDDMKQGEDLGDALTETIMDNFGGILGYSYQDAPFSDVGAGDAHVIHYSQLQKAYNLIQDCEDVDPENFRPASWDETKNGAWHPTLDGLIVQVDGNYSRCKARKVDFVPWSTLSFPNIDGFYRGGPAVDAQQRTRVPYAFATDRWADLGNLSVYRHDNGADPYELFNFFITEQEVKHIFDNYRRNRQTFSVNSAQSRVLNRYNAKMRDGAKGMGLIANSLIRAGQERGIEPSSYLAALVDFWGWGDNMLAAGMTFDHYARQMQRPQPGPHGERENAAGNAVDWVLRSEEGGTVMLVPDGAQGYWANVGIGGKRVNNALAEGKGEYDSEFTMNAGSYYDKLHTTMLLTESVDNFISDSLEDFVEARDRSISMADLYPDGFRRFLANNLTDDEWAKAPRVAAGGLGAPLTDPDGYPAQPIGWTTWWTDTTEVCFPNNGTTVCSGFGIDGDPFKVSAPDSMRPVDPQVGWEQQKFMIANTLIYLPENQRQSWLDMLGIWSLGEDSDPGFENRIELHVPTGDVYIAHTYGTEEICFEASPVVPTGCKTVQRGISARILEYANELLAQAYVTTPVTVNGVTWHQPVIDADGAPIVRFDPNLIYITPSFQIAPPPPGCEEDPDPLDADYSSFENCECNNNVKCMEFAEYISVPNFMRQAMADFHMADPSMKGIFE